MKIITGSRCMGKTTRCLKWLAESPATRKLLVPNKHQARMLWDLAQEDGLVGVTENNFVTPRQLSIRGHEWLGCEVAIDNLEEVLLALVGEPVTVATVGPVDIAVLGFS